MNKTYQHDDGNAIENETVALMADDGIDIEYPESELVLLTVPRPATDFLRENVYKKHDELDNPTRKWVRCPSVVETMCSYIALQKGVSTHKILSVGVSFDGSHPCVTAMHELGDIRKNIQFSSNATLRKQLTTTRGNYPLFEGERTQVYLEEEVVNSISAQAAAAGLNTQDVALLRFMVWYETLLSEVNNVVVMEDTIEVMEYKLHFEVGMKRFMDYAMDVRCRNNISTKYIKVGTCDPGGSALKHGGN